MIINDKVEMFCPKCGSEPKQNITQTGQVSYDVICPKCDERMKLLLIRQDSAGIVND